MQALQFTHTGDLSALKLVDLPEPVRTDDEVLIDVRAAGLNPSDVKNVLGRFPYTTLPRIPGRDFAGVVLEGPQHLIGQSVWGTGKGPGFSRDGSHAQHLTLPANGVALMPKSLSFSQAASCGVPYTTAWDALERCQVGSGTRLLVIGVGAVGSAALSLAKARGAQVLAGVRRAGQANELQERGFSTVTLEVPEDLAVQVNQVFAGGADVIFDTTGFWLPASVPALATFGRIAVIAAPVDGNVQLPALALYRRGGAVVGVNSLLYDTIDSAKMLTQLGQLFDDGHLPLPTNIHESPLHEGVQRYREVNEGRSDKIVLIP
ncbi:Mycocerosic acid synthase [compost metagenome]